MKKLIFFKVILLCLSLNLYASSTNIKNAHAIGIFDENGNGENIQHTRKTKADYNGTCFTKVVVIGEFYHTKPEVYIGNSRGYFQKSKSIYNKRKVKIGEVLTYQHFNVSSGYINVKIDNKTYDFKVFVK
ncbi:MULTISPECIES: hypothetical protein [Malaciobacter]|jgi:hypothetical protein|uniref:DUF5666 domain-containing protein n=2 Tax=Malaciobacter TaxID=2321114 RepID=A0AB36ZWC1_9BACT|nr:MULTISPECIES: hypothetical protein [Malaciobacter]PHO10544.1 hypothetical protein CPG37_03615 [Malaciobacter canalis]PPK60935.1 hypothetical protein B0F89_11414 [Malaciobacter marinus]QEE31993.1 hypothetical protein ACAN_0488 [Malaciobacter canalis]SKB44236.1 hypothetical protein SAMN06295997_11252 [Malaciobacter marinus]